MANKFSQNNKFQIKEMGLDLDENKVSLSQEESKKLNIYCDNVERVERKNQEAILSIGSLTKKVIDNFLALSESVFDLGEAFETLTEGYRTIESITGSGLRVDFVKQSELYEKISNCCLENAQAIKRSGSNFERHLLPFLKVHESNFQHLDHVPIDFLTR